MKRLLGLVGLLAVGGVAMAEDVQIVMADLGIDLASGLAALVALLATTYVGVLGAKLAFVYLRKAWYRITSVG